MKYNSKGMTRQLQSMAEIRYPSDIVESALWHKPGPFRDQCPLFRFENAALCMAFSANMSGLRLGHI